MRFRLLVLTMLAVDVYASTNECSPCHSQIVQKYKYSGMARTFGPAGTEGIRDGSVNHTKSQRSYDVLLENNRVIQQRILIGGPIEPLRRAATYVIGSGNHARSYLVREPDDTLTQLPLTWYTQEQSWGMSPGYDKPHHSDFTRQIDHGCIFCHNSYPSKDVQFGQLPQFERSLPSGIGCDRCHGSTKAHVANPSRSNIINPRRFSPDRSFDLCLQCHLETTSAKLPHAIRRFGRGVYSFKPGETLSDYLVSFDHPASAGREDKFEINSSGYRLMQSKCFRVSARMTCTTCHDPHAPASATDSRAACLGCHAMPHADGDCAGCHMPKRRTDDAVHVVITDHKIQVVPGNAAALTEPKEEQDMAWKGRLEIYRTPGLSTRERDLYLGMGLVDGNADRKEGIVLLERGLAFKPAVEAMAELGAAYLSEGRTEAGIRWLKRALGIIPVMPQVRLTLASALHSRSDLEPLIGALPFNANVLNTFGTLLLPSPAARSYFERATLQRPAFAEPENNLGMLALASGDLANAELHFRAALMRDPDLAPAWNNMGRLEAERGNLDKATAFIEKAVETDSDYAESRYNLGRLYQAQNRHQPAIEQLSKAIVLNPGLISSHIALGVSYGELGQHAAATRCFEQALKIDPKNEEARRNLSIARELVRP